MSAIAHVRSPSDEMMLDSRYSLVARVASGGMAEVFLAYLHGVEGFRKPVAIKRIQPHIAADPAFVRMFLDEAQTAARLSHPHICETFELFEHDGEYYLSMEWLEGVTLRDVLQHAIDNNQPVSGRITATLLHQACSALAYAHDLVDFDGRPAGLVHRDLTPSNLLLTSSGFVKILDFGIAKAKWVSSRTKTGILKGNAAYMSPEQVRASDLDHRSDLFSLGVIGYELLTGNRLFRRSGDYETLRAVIGDPIPAVEKVGPKISRPLAKVITTALSRGIKRRYQSAQQLAEAIQQSVPDMATPLELSAFVQNKFGNQLRQRRTQLDSSNPTGDEEITKPREVKGKRVATEYMVFSPLHTQPLEVSEARERRPTQNEKRGCAKAWSPLFVATIAILLLTAVVWSMHCLQVWPFQSLQ